MKSPAAGPFTLESLQASPNQLAGHYQRFKVQDRLLLSGHSHQAWPDCAFDGQRQAWLDAAEHVDQKWAYAFDQAEEVRRGYRRLLDDPTGRYCLSASTHNVLVRLISALSLSERPQFVTTDAEFHSVRRLFARLAEEGIEIVRVAAHPSDSVGERLAAAVSDRTAAVYTSTVFFKSAHIAGNLEPAAQACRHHGTLLILDVYHQLNVVPYSLMARGLEDAYVVGGGYKYCQLGEGNAFLRFPQDCDLRPVVTGWFAEFGQMTQEPSPHHVAYSGADNRFAGGTYDPTANYRGARVFNFLQEHQLVPSLLRQVSQHQIGTLCRAFDDLDFDPVFVSRDRSVPLDRLGGFLPLTSPRAGELHQALLRAGVHTDFRGDILRFGPAPYLSDRQLNDAISILGEVAKNLSESVLS